MIIQLTVCRSAVVLTQAIRFLKVSVIEKGIKKDWFAFNIERRATKSILADAEGSKPRFVNTLSLRTPYMRLC